jgi:hypothetical protein
VGALLGHLTLVDDEHPVVLAQCLVREPPMRRQAPRVVPAARADKLLHGPHLAVGRRPGPQQAQGECLDVLARHVGRQQPAQVERRPAALLAALEQRGEVRVVGRQLLHHAVEVGGRQRAGGGDERRQVNRGGSGHGGPPLHGAGHELAAILAQPFSRCTTRSWHSYDWTDRKSVR